MKIISITNRFNSHSPFKQMEQQKRLNLINPNQKWRDRNHKSNHLGTLFMAILGWWPNKRKRPISRNWHFCKEVLESFRLRGNSNNMQLLRMHVLKTRDIKQRRGNLFNMLRSFCNKSRRGTGIKGLWLRRLRYRALIICRRSRIWVLRILESVWVRVSLCRGLM